MKTIFLLRHAKSSWDDPQLADFHRPLARRGIKAAPRVGAYMASNGFIPDRVLCSAARRASETWALVSRELEDGPQVEFREDIYHASASSLLALLKELPDSDERVLLVGHNPTFEELALALAPKGNPESLASMVRKFPTGALAVLDVPVERWAELREGIGYLRDFVVPRKLRA